MDLHLTRPLAVFDIEATGAVARTDRIVELAVVRLFPPPGERDLHVWRVNPERPIPPEATRIHGITDADVAGCPPFRDIARDVLKVFEGCDLAGYNLLRFDIPLLMEECARSGYNFELAGRRIVDAQRIFHRRERRDLTAALAFYCGEQHLDAHGAQADVLATIRVLEGQLKRYPDLPRDVAALDAYCHSRDPSWVDREGRLCWKNGEIVLNFGRKKGESLKAVIEKDPSFAKWMLRSDFPPDVQDIVSRAMRGEWPSPPSARSASTQTAEPSGPCGPVPGNSQ